jgi:hypothetical protein
MQSALSPDGRVLAGRLVPGVGGRGDYRGPLVSLGGGALGTHGIALLKIAGSAPERPACPEPARVELGDEVRSEGAHCPTFVALTPRCYISSAVGQSAMRASPCAFSGTWRTTMLKTLPDDPL